MVTHVADADGAPNSIALEEVPPRNLKGILNTENLSNDQFFTYSAHGSLAILLILIMQETTEIGTARIHGSVRLRFGYDHFPVALHVPEANQCFRYR